MHVVRESVAQISNPTGEPIEAKHQINIDIMTSQATEDGKGPNNNKCAKVPKKDGSGYMKGRRRGQNSSKYSMPLLSTVTGEGIASPFVVIMKFESLLLDKVYPEKLVGMSPNSIAGAFGWVVLKNQKTHNKHVMSWHFEHVLGPFSQRLQMVELDISDQKTFDWCMEENPDLIPRVLVQVDGADDNMKGFFEFEHVMEYVKDTHLQVYSSFKLSIALFSNFQSRFFNLHIYRC